MILIEKDPKQTERGIYGYSENVHRCPICKRDTNVFYKPFPEMKPVIACDIECAKKIPALHI